LKVKIQGSRIYELWVYEDIVVLVTGIAVGVDSADGACPGGDARSVEIAAGVIDVVIGDGWTSGYAVDPTA